MLTRPLYPGPEEEEIIIAALNIKKGVGGMPRRLLRFVGRDVGQLEGSD